MNWENISPIDVLTLIVAVAFGVANFWYTRRTYERTFYPILLPNLKMESAKVALEHDSRIKTVFDLKLENPSNKIPLKDITIRVKVANSLKQRIWQQEKWHLYKEYKIQQLNPGKSLEDVKLADGNEIRSAEASFEEFLCKQFPEVIRVKTKTEIISELPGFTDEKYYFFQDLDSIKLLVTIEYGIEGKSSRKNLSQKYDIRPKHYFDSQLSGWQLTQID